MKLSKFYHKKQVDDNVYAIFNALIMNVIFVTKEELELIENYKYSDNEVLLENGIYVLTEKEDNNALQTIREMYLSNVGKVNILYLCVTDSCNFDCKYCFVNKSSDNIKKYNAVMNFDTAKIAVDKWLEHTKLHNIQEKTILFYGGEPLLNFKLIQKVVDYISSLNETVNYEIVTNGSLITEEVAKFFKQNSFSVGVSIDGPKEMNDKNRVFNNSELGTYDKVLAGMNILNENMNNFGLSITLSHTALDNQDNILKWLKEIKPRGIYYNLLHITNSEIDWKEYADRANKFLIKSHKELKNIPILEGCMNRKIESYYNEKFKFANCAAIGLNQISIKANGDVCVCQGCSKISYYDLGHISDFDFENIKTAENKLWIEKAPIMNEECLSCPALFLCGGGCVMEAEAIFKDPYHLDLPFCIHSNEMLEWLLKSSYVEMEYENEEIK